MRPAYLICEKDEDLTKELVLDLFEEKDSMTTQLSSESGGQPTILTPDSTVEADPKSPEAPRSSPRPPSASPTTSPSQSQSSIPPPIKPKPKRKPPPPPKKPAFLSVGSTSSTSTSPTRSPIVPPKPQELGTSILEIGNLDIPITSTPSPTPSRPIITIRRLDPSKIAPSRFQQSDPVNWDAATPSPRRTASPKPSPTVRFAPSPRLTPSRSPAPRRDRYESQDSNGDADEEIQAAIAASLESFR
ncbi:uncharacterized protein BDZ99DRAFT_235904 [Mytilinidion resinicola]|uniref:Uncharacterized protein n=1 Tax=Mytilinidion resinicola TaxID=574789 RepID=A0A6A6Z269_9PEZI|nr:uncharacterized protein BDZ99DRAFT_235904 [Mytilinidion resinicola]KAF2814384.1 hypothetical protein BDZ99DRAFT_235904 [Mytilinidion resinicola]